MNYLQVKKTLYALVACLLLFCFVAYLLLHFNNSTHFNKELQGRIVKGQSKIKISDLTTFDWNMACYIKTRQMRHDTVDDYNLPQGISDFFGKKVDNIQLKYNCGEQLSGDFSSSTIIFLSEAGFKFINTDICSLRTENEAIKTNSYHCFHDDAYLQITKAKPYNIRYYNVIIRNSDT